MRRFFKTLKNMLGLNMGRVLMFGIVYHALSAAVVWETLRRGSTWALEKAGYSYLTAGNIIPFLLKPATLLFVFGVMGLWILVLLIEVSVYMGAFEAAEEGKAVYLSEMILTGLKRVCGLLGRKKAVVIVYFLSFYLLTQIFILYRLLCHIRPVNYLLKEFFDWPPSVFILAGAGIILFGISMAGLYMMHFSLLEKQSGKEARKSSSHLVRKYLFRTFFLLMAVNIFIGVFFAGFDFLGNSLVVLVVMMFVKKNFQLAMVLIISDYLDIGLLFITSVFSLALNTAMITRMFYCFQGRRKLEEVREEKLPEADKKGRKQVILYSLILAVLSIVYVSGSIYSNGVISRLSLSDIRITSHRGYSSNAPENTIPAVERAMDVFADFVEIDVQESKDGELILLHDNTFKRTAGLNKKPSELTWEQIQTLDVGKWFHPSYTGTRVPSLRQVLEQAKGKIRLNIEIKSIKNNTLLPDKVVREIEACDMVEGCVISSSNYNYLCRIKELNPDIRTGYIMLAAYGNYFEDENVDFFSVRSSFLTSTIVQTAHTCGKEVHAWTVNTKAELNRMKQLGVDNVITDNPILAREILNGEGTAESLFEFIELALQQ